jgi:hypothetical protein
MDDIHPLISKYKSRRGQLTMAKISNKPSNKKPQLTTAVEVTKKNPLSSTKNSPPKTLVEPTTVPTQHTPAPSSIFATLKNFLKKLFTKKASTALTDPIDPPGDPIDPPGDPIDPPGDPVDPPGDPIDPPGEDATDQADSTSDEKQKIDRQLDTIENNISDKHISYMLEQTPSNTNLKLNTFEKNYLKVKKVYDDNLCAFEKLQQDLPSKWFLEYARHFTQIQNHLKSIKLGLEKSLNTLNTLKLDDLYAQIQYAAAIGGKVHHEKNPTTKKELINDFKGQLAKLEQQTPQIIELAKSIPSEQHNINKALGILRNITAGVLKPTATKKPQQPSKNKNGKSIAPSSLF